jgi:DNA-binding NtrC family response regulator
MLGPNPKPTPEKTRPTPSAADFPCKTSESDRRGPILIVSRARRMLAKLKGPLGREGYRVFRAEGIEDALAFCTMLPGRLSLVIVDWMDPGLDAERLLAELHGVAPDLPLLLMEEGRLSAGALSGLRDPVLTGFLRDLALDV